MIENMKVGAVADLFDVSTETIRRWAMEFEDYLSSNANPDSGQTRIFMEEDLQVFALIAETKDRGGTYDDAHARLRAGERGIVPEEPLDKEAQKLALNQLYNSFKEIEAERNQLRNEVERLEDDLQKSREEIARLKGKGEGQERIETELKESRSRIEELVRQVARLEVILEIEREKNSD